jgi:hypothetical protein
LHSHHAQGLKDLQARQERLARQEPTALTELKDRQVLRVLLDLKVHPVLIL